MLGMIKCRVNGFNQIQAYVFGIDLGLYYDVLVVLLQSILDRKQQRIFLFSTHASLALENWSRFQYLIHIIIHILRLEYSRVYLREFDEHYIQYI